MRQMDNIHYGPFELNRGRYAACLLCAIDLAVKSALCGEPLTG